MREQVARCAGGQSVLCALSGGVDSVVLLHLLLQCGVRVEAAHVEHGIRGESSGGTAGLYRSCAESGACRCTSSISMFRRRRQKRAGASKKPRAQCAMISFGKREKRAVLKRWPLRTT